MIALMISIPSTRMAVRMLPDIILGTDVTEMDHTNNIENVREWYLAKPY